MDPRRRRVRDFVKRDWVVGDSIWRVQYMHRLPEGWLGSTDPSEFLVSIKMGQTLEGEIETLIHEFIHVLMYSHVEGCRSLKWLLGHRMIERVEKKLAKFVVENFLGH